MTFDPAEQAWLVKEYLAARTQREIGDELGMTSSPICIAIKQFCDDWSGVDVQKNQIYGPDRQRYALKALQSYFFRTDGLIRRPAFRTVAARSAAAFLPTVVPSNMAAAVHPDEPYFRARREHAWLLRAEGKTYREIGLRLGVSRERTRQMICQFGRKVSWAIRRVRWIEARTAA